MNKFMIFAVLMFLLTVFVACVGVNEELRHQNNQTGLTGNNGNDAQNGMRIRWYPNGTKAEAVEFDSGQKTGSYTAWYENGQVKLKCRFFNDILDGEVAAWFEDGRKRFSVYYVNGKRHGKWIRYHEKHDAIVASMNFEHDQLDGVISAAFEQGNGNGIGRSYVINSVFQEGVLVKSFHLAHTNTDGHTVISKGNLSDNNGVKFDKQKNVTMDTDGTLHIDFGHFSKTYYSLQDFFISEINLHVVTKFSLDFCNGSENIWPCQFSQNTI